MSLSPATRAGTSMRSSIVSTLPCLTTTCPFTSEHQTNINTTFRQRYGQFPDFYVSAPGRVNLIGEHIDYAGYGVLPMALSKTVWMAVARAPSSVHKIRVEHMNAEQFPAGSFPKDPQAAIPNAQHAWYHYVQCGYKGAWLADTATPSCTGNALQILVGGTIPLAAGLSSSSALVVASTLATLYCTPQPTIPHRLEEIAELARQAEGFIGTMGGGMDQAISVMGQARLVQFDPVRTLPVTLPPEAVFVVANSLTPAEKAVAAHVCYNKRVVEMMLASKVLARALALPDVLSYKTFAQVQNALAKQQDRPVPLDEMQQLARRHLCEEYTEADLLGVLSPAAWEDWFPHASSEERVRIGQVREAATSYVLRGRAVHVYAEAERVWQFQRACALNDDDASPASTLDTLGALMNASHVSCDELYECSCPELNALTQRCRDLGALGSRLTGAGWGGSCVSLVSTKHLDTFLEGLKDYYATNVSLAKGQDWNEICFSAVPTPGASIYVPTSLENGKA